MAGLAITEKFKYDGGMAALAAMFVNVNKISSTNHSIILLINIAASAAIPPSYLKLS